MADGSTDTRQVETVTMTDGRKVDFVGKRKLLKDYTIDGDTVTCTFDFRNGETSKLSFAVGDALTLNFAGHGAIQKVGDETAGLDSVDDMVLAVNDIIERLNKGEWSVKREGSGFAGTSVLVKALVELAGGKKTVEDVKAFLKDKTQADKMALRANPRVKVIIDRLEAEKSATSKVDTEAMLATL